jgi:hypothetical protein
MPRAEARIFTSIWKDPDFLDLEPGPQRLYMFLLSQDDLTYAGVLPLRIPRWATKARGLTAEGVEKDLAALESAPRPFVIVDYDSMELLVRSLLRRDNAWKQPNLFKLARESMQQVESARIRSALAAELHRLPVSESPSKQVHSLVAAFIRDLEVASPMALPYPTANPTDEGTGYPSDEGTANPADDPTAKDYACARENGGGNGSSEGTLRTPGSLAPTPPTPPAHPDGADDADRKRGTRLPESFYPDAEMVAWFRENCPHVDGRTEHAKFHDHWVSQVGWRGRKLDWVATWRNWMRRAESEAKPRTRGSPSVPNLSAADQRRADVATLRELDRQRREGQPAIAIPGSVIE